MYDDLNMTNSSGMPTTNDPTVANSTGPDWDLVPFDVPCARCGHDLRGLTDPVCPACKLEFDWSVAVPIENLTCEKCDYHLFGLTETRCPECGERFTWELALASYERRRHLLFEYRWRDRPIRSLVRTVYLMFRPRLLWQELDIHDRPQMGPSVVMPACALLTLVAVPPFLRALYRTAWLARYEWDWITWAECCLELLSYLREAYTGVYTYGPPFYVGTWSLLTLGSLFLLPQSMKRYRVRSVQVVRVWTYCVPLPASIAFLVSTCVVGISLLLRFDTRVVGFFLSCLIVPAALYVVFLLRQGCKQYLKIPHAWGVAIAAHLIGFLGSTILAALLGL